MSFSQRLTELRNRKGMSQYEISERLGIKRPRYNAWEQGLSKPRADMLNKIAELFEVTPDYLLGFEQEKKISPVTESVKKQDLNEILASKNDLLFDGIPLTDEDKENLLRVMEAMLFNAKKAHSEKE